MKADFQTAIKRGAPHGLVPVERSSLGAALGAGIAKMQIEARRQNPGLPDMCATCGFREGTLANQSLDTLALAAECIISGEAFMCHDQCDLDDQGMLVNPKSACRGWQAIRMADPSMIRSPGEEAQK